MENYNLKDNLNISEGLSIKGLVIIKDSSGNIIVKKHNMIVESGRKAIMSALINKKGTIGINKIFFSDKFKNTDTSIAPVAYNDAYPTDDKPDNWLEVTLGSVITKDEDGTEKTTSVTDGNSNFSILYDLSVSEPYIEIEGTLTHDDVNNATEIRTLGLLIDTTLFSRIIFEPIPFTNKTESYSIKYYIYF